jgi:hypothetical protein
VPSKNVLHGPKIWASVGKHEDEVNVELNFFLPFSSFSIQMHFMWLKDVRNLFSIVDHVDL